MTEQTTDILVVNREWPAKEEYSQIKSQFVEEHLSGFKGYFEDPNNYSLFVNLDQKQKDLGAKLLSLFAFGVSMAYRKFGEKYTDIPITAFTDAKVEDNWVVAFRSDSNRFAINLPKLIDQIKAGESDIVGNVGGVKRITLTDAFELGGVEEGAHYLFFNEKGHLGREGAKSPGEQDLREIELKALLWKMKYSKLYMPQYCSDLKHAYQVGLRKK